MVVGACSPHLHEKTFRNACAMAGLNPYLMQMASLREQVSWVTEDKALALEKAKALISGAVRRVQLQEELQPTPVPVNPHTLVVGGGVAGIQAALELAEAGYPVFMVEREPSIGGHMAQFDKTFPTLDCSACILTPKMSDVGTHEKITLLSYAEVEEVKGFVGNFQVRIRKKARGVDEKDCTGCGICIEKCPRKVVDDVFEAGMGYRKAIYRPFPQAVPKYPRHRPGQLHLLRTRHVQGVREVLPDQRHSTSTRKTRSSTWRSATSSWPRAGTCSTPAGCRSTATGAWPMSSPIWSSSGCATPPARRTARSCCATA